MRGLARETRSNSGRLDIRSQARQAERPGEPNTQRRRESLQLLCSNLSEALIRLHCSTGFQNRHPGDTVSHGHLNKPRHRCREAAPGSRGASFSEVMERKRWKQSSQAQANALILCSDQLLSLEGARTFLGTSGGSSCLSVPATAEYAARPERCFLPPLKSNLTLLLDMIA